MQLGPDAGIVGRQGAVRQARPEAADVGREPLGLGRIDANSPRSRRSRGPARTPPGRPDPCDSGCPARPGSAADRSAARTAPCRSGGNRRPCRNGPCGMWSAGKPSIVAGHVLRRQPRRGDQQAAGQGRPALAARRDREPAARQGRRPARTAWTPRPTRRRPRSRPPGPAYSRGWRTGRSRATGWRRGRSAPAPAPAPGRRSDAPAPRRRWSCACSKIASISPTSSSCVATTSLPHLR